MIRGFTIIEALLTIAIVSVLIALTLPRFAEFRYQANYAVALARLGQHSAVITMYTSDHRSFFPYLSDPDNPFKNPIPWSGGLIRTHYFGVFNCWNVALADMYYGGRAGDPSFESPFRPAALRGSLYTDYFYANVYLARPEFWTTYSRIGPSQWAPTRAEEVVFPARKSLLVFGPDGIFNVDFNRWTGALAFVDGSASRTPKVLRGHPEGEGTWPGCLNVGELVAMHTLEGVRGVDVP